MQSYMFRSRRNALIFAGLVVIGALFAVGGEDNPGEVIESSDQLVAERAAFNEEMASAARAEEAPAEEAEDDQYLEDDQYPEEDDFEYADDAELIDEATGFDPSPDPEFFDGRDFDDGVASDF